MHDLFVSELRGWRPASAEQGRLRDEYLAFLARRGESALRREGGAEHVTASCFVLSEDRARVLLTLHRKAGRWLQFGGHVEPSDASVAAAALREGVEESGVPGLRLVSDTPVDLDRHRLVGAFGACTVHWDVGYLALTEGDATPAVSEESDDVRWWSLTELGELDPALSGRIARVLRSSPSAELTPPPDHRAS